jgi:hypothetical protein
MRHTLARQLGTVRCTGQRCLSYQIWLSLAHCSAIAERTYGGLVDYCRLQDIRNGPRCSAPPCRFNRSECERGYGMVFVAMLDTSLSAPAAVYAFTAKYQVPEAKPVSVCVETLALAICAVWSRLELERP